MAIEKADESPVTNVVRLVRVPMRVRDVPCEKTILL